eukprot:2413302-Prymnesium_polylepis.1
MSLEAKASRHRDRKRAATQRAHCDDCANQARHMCARPNGCGRGTHTAPCTLHTPHTHNSHSPQRDATRVVRRPDAAGGEPHCARSHASALARGARERAALQRPCIQRWRVSTSFGEPHLIGASAR